MPANDSTQALLLAAESEFQEELRIWGTGGWQPPRQREALDWLTLMRFCGWGVQVVPVKQELEAPGVLRGLRWMVVGCPPESVSEARVLELERLLQAQPVCLVLCCTEAESPLSKLSGTVGAAGGREVSDATWCGAGAAGTWTFRRPITAHDVTAVRDVQTWVRGPDGIRLVMARRYGAGIVVTLAFHPGEARDVSGSATDLVRRVLIRAARAPVAWVEWSGTMALRMDDPGGSQNVFCRSWCYPELGEGEWQAIGEDLQRRHARLSVAYSAGWVDDGDAERGELLLDGKPVERVPGRVHPSSRVWYRDLRGHLPGAISDYAGQYRMLRKLRDAGAVEIELHGYTHMHPAHEDWACAPDRYEAVDWFRELGATASAAIASAGRDHHPLALGVRALAEQFGVRPTSLICPGDEWTNPALEFALELDIDLVSSHYHALRDSGRFCWTTDVCAPYLDEPESRWFDAALPVIGYFHDQDLAVKGVSWLSRCLDAWQAVGARRWIDLAEVAAVLSAPLSLETAPALLRLQRSGTRMLPRRTPLTVNVRFPGGEAPTRLEVWSDGQRQEVAVERLDPEEGRVVLP